MSVFHSASVLIGAPKANTSQVNITEGGSVFYCPWSLSQSDCHAIEFDTEGKTFDWSKQHNNLVFGASTIWDLLSGSFPRLKRHTTKALYSKTELCSFAITIFVFWLDCL